MKKVLVVLTIISFYNNLQAQSIGENKKCFLQKNNIKANIEYSPLFDYLFEKNKPEFRGKNYYGINLKYIVNNKDTLYSKYLYRNMQHGFGIHSSELNNKQFGYLAALYYFFEVPFHRNLIFNNSFSYSLAAGLGYVNSPNNIINYNGTFLMSTRLNIYFELKLNHSLVINRMLTLGLYVGYKHFSNAAIKMPNVGMNFATIGIELGYLPKKKSPIYNFSNIPKHNNTLQMEFSSNIGHRKLKNSSAEITKTAFSCQLQHAISYKYTLSIGADITLSNIYNNEDAVSGLIVSYSLVGGWNWKINRRLYVPMRIGYYLKSNKEIGEFTKFYEKVGIAYNVNDKFAVATIVKAHKKTADYISLAIFYTLKIK